MYEKLTEAEYQDLMDGFEKFLDKLESQQTKEE